MQPDAATPADEQVELHVPALSSYVGVLRTVAAGVAARGDLTIDEIEDIRLAVDEACALLLPHALATQPLVARFAVRAGAVHFEAAVSTAAAAEPDRNGFSWSILAALAVDPQVQASESRLSIGFGKEREATAGAA